MMLHQLTNIVRRTSAAFILAVAVIFANPADGIGQVQGVTHSELDWFTINTTHFQVHFHAGSERTASLVAAIAEDIYEPITSIYDYEPDEKLHFVVRDHDDYSNGAAYYFDNKIEIWASAMDFELRGTHNWLRNVVTHEFVHMVQLQSANKLTRKIPAFYFQWIGYEDETRPDVLRGYPNTIVSYPILTTVMPSWFAEGVAQYQTPTLTYDTWDSHRDMLLRSAVLEKKLLSFDEMSSFGKNSIGNEMAYNQGFSLVAYMVERFGLETLKKASRAMRSPLRTSFSSAMKKSTGIRGHEIYLDWKRSLSKHYESNVQTIRRHLAEGELFEKEGIGNFYPAWSADGRRLAYLSSLGSRSLSRTNLVIREIDEDKPRVLKSGVRMAFDWADDRGMIVYSKRTDPNRHGSYYYDLYCYDTKTRKETRLSRDLRAHSPALSPDGSRIAFVLNGDGTQNLAMMDAKSGMVTKLTGFQSNEQVYKPEWSPDGEDVVYGFTTGNGRSLRIMNIASRESRSVAEGAHDTRDAVYAPDGHAIYFSSDATGIFNIYRYELATGVHTQLTNVLGGAFMPAPGPDGRIAFASYGAEGYKISIIDPKSTSRPTLSEYQPGPPWQKLANGQAVANGSSNMPASESLSSGPNLAALNAKSYRNVFSSVAFFPRVTRDYGTTKVGSYFSSSEMLNNHSLFAGFGVNRDRDYDLFLLFDYNRFGPRIFLEGYNQVQHSSADGDDFRYNLAEVNVGLETRLPYRPNHFLKLAFIYSQYNANIKTLIQGRRESFSYTYHIGRTLQLRYLYDGIGFTGAIDAAPRGGRRVQLALNRDWNLFISGFEINQNFGTVQEVYDRYYVNRVSADVLQYFPGLAPRHAGMLRLRGGYIDRQIDSFFNFFAGGLDGMRGYPYYSVEGRKLVQGTLAYRVPLIRKISAGLGPLRFDQLYLGVFADYGNAFDDKLALDEFKRTIGAQVRLNAFSFYAFPTRIFFDAAYGLDRFTTEGVTYGKAWRYYFGITFGYLD